MSREDAYRLVQTHAMRAWREGLNLRTLVMNDRAITARVPTEKLDEAFNLKRQLRNVDKIFDRVFGKGQPKVKGAKKPAAAGRKSSRAL